MTKRQRVVFAALSDTGLEREANEDSMGHVQLGERHLFVTADGMGGENGGCQASKTVVDLFCDTFRADSGGGIGISFRSAPA